LPRLLRACPTLSQRVVVHSFEPVKGPTYKPHAPPPGREGGRRVLRAPGCSARTPATAAPETRCPCEPRVVIQGHALLVPGWNAALQCHRDPFPPLPFPRVQPARPRRAHGPPQTWVRRRGAVPHASPCAAPAHNATWRTMVDPAPLGCTHRRGTQPVARARSPATRVNRGRGAPTRATGAGAVPCRPPPPPPVEWGGVQTQPRLAPLAIKPTKGAHCWLCSSRSECGPQGARGQPGQAAARG